MANVGSLSIQLNANSATLQAELLQARNKLGAFEKAAVASGAAMKTATGAAAGTTGKMSQLQQVLQQSTFAVEDAASQWGTAGLSGALRGASNNLTMIGALLGGLPAMIGVVAVTTGVQLYQAFAKSSASTADYTARLKELENQLSAVQKAAHFDFRFPKLDTASAAKSLQASLDEERIVLDAGIEERHKQLSELYGKEQTDEVKKNVTKLEDEVASMTAESKQLFGQRERIRKKLPELEAGDAARKRKEEAESMTAATRTPMEQAEAKLAQADTLFSSGDLGKDTLLRIANEADEIRNKQLGDEHAERRKFVEQEAKAKAAADKAALQQEVTDRRAAMTQISTEMGEKKAHLQALQSEREQISANANRTVGASVRGSREAFSDIARINRQAAGSGDGRKNEEQQLKTQQQIQKLQAEANKHLAKIAEGQQTVTIDV